MAAYRHQLVEKPLAKFVGHGDQPVLGKKTIKGRHAPGGGPGRRYRLAVIDVAPGMVVFVDGIITGRHQARFVELYHPV